MIYAKTRLHKIPKSCKVCNLSYENFCGERTCAITNRDCPWEQSENGNWRYCKPVWCPLVEANGDDRT